MKQTKSLFSICSNSSRRGRNWNQRINKCQVLWSKVRRRAENNVNLGWSERDVEFFQESFYQLCVHFNLTFCTHWLSLEPCPFPQPWFLLGRGTSRETQWSICPLSAGWYLLVLLLFPGCWLFKKWTEFVREQGHLSPWIEILLLRQLATLWDHNLQTWHLARFQGASELPQTTALPVLLQARQLLRSFPFPSLLAAERSAFASSPSSSLLQSPSDVLGWRE